MKYYVNKNKRTVTVTMDDSNEKINLHKQAFDYITKSMSNEMVNHCNYMPHINGALHIIFNQSIRDHVKKRYSGVAYCSPNDNFDEDTGIALARARCLKKYYKDIAAAAQECADELNTMTAWINYKQNTANNSVVHWDETINKLKA